MIYAFTLIGAEGKGRPAGVREAASDDEACEIASELLIESAAPVIEVWRGRWMIFRVSKIDPLSYRKPPASSADRVSGPGARDQISPSNWAKT